MSTQHDTLRRLVEWAISDASVPELDSWLIAPSELRRRLLAALAAPQATEPELSYARRVRQVADVAAEMDKAAGMARAFMLGHIHDWTSDDADERSAMAWAQQAARCATTLESLLPFDAPQAKEHPHERDDQLSRGQDPASGGADSARPKNGEKPHAQGAVGASVQGAGGVSQAAHRGLADAPQAGETRADWREYVQHKHDCRTHMNGKRWEPEFIRKGKTLYGAWVPDAAAQHSCTCGLDQLLAARGADASPVGGTRAEETKMPPDRDATCDWNCNLTYPHEGPCSPNALASPASVRPDPPQETGKIHTCKICGAECSC
jgi:hypothetical protein